jgi:hypothetical protein
MKAGREREKTQLERVGETANKRARESERR